MSEENKALVRQFFQLVNQRRIDALGECWVEDFVMHPPNYPGNPSEVSGLENLKKFAEKLLSAYPDAHYTLEDMIADGDKVAFRFTWRGTFKGEFLGKQPTGERVVHTGIAIYRFEGGKIIEDWGLEAASLRPEDPWK